MEEHPASEDGQYQSGGKGKSKKKKAPIVGVLSAVFLGVLGIVLIGLACAIWIPLGQRGQVFAQSALSLAIFVVVIFQACIYFRQARALDRQVRYAARQTRLSRQLTKTALNQFEVTDRPWVKFEAQFTKSLIFDGRGGVDTQLRVRAKNIGRSVALNTTINVALIAPNMALGGDGPGEILAEQAKVCQHVDSTYSAYVLFPEDVYEFLKGFSLTNEQIERGRLAGTSFIKFVFVGCVDYQFVGHERHHQTRFAYEIVRRVPEGRLPLLVDADVSIHELTLEKMFMGGDYAD
jgi:hypothetical protein